MKDGNWIPIDKNLSKFFPDRKFSEIEAAFSLTLDYDNNKSASIAGYSKLWGWSRSKVRLFLDNMGVEICYPEDVSKKQNQKGQIKGQIKDRSRTDQGQIRMVNSKGSQGTKDRSETDQGQIKDRSSNSTSKPIKPKPKPSKKTSGPEAYSEAFERWWLIFPKRNGRVRGKQKTFPLFKSILKSQYQDLKTATLNYSKEEHIRDPERFLKDGYWKDFVGDAGPINSKEINPHEPTKMTTRELIDRGMLNHSESDKPQLPETE